MLGTKTINYIYNLFNFGHTLLIFKQKVQMIGTQKKLYEIFLLWMI